jgi:hypothetical protein
VPLEALRSVRRVLDEAPASAGLELQRLGMAILSRGSDAGRARR